ncbi:MAG: hypothetical protein ACK4N5_06250, partial [Myxococcales bacterium]
SDPVFRYANFANAGATARLGRLRLSGAAWVAMDADNQRGQLAAAWRFLGPTASTGLNDGTFLEAEALAGHHRFGDDGFGASALDLRVRGRYALQRISRLMRGAFGELALGYGGQLIGYGNGAQDVADRLLFDFGFGVNLGRAGPLRGEAMVFYDHSRDGFARALRGFSGVPGAFGLRTRMYLTERWGLTAEGAYGSAFTGRLAAVYHFGGQR